MSQIMFYRTIAIIAAAKVQHFLQPAKYFLLFLVNNFLYYICINSALRLT